MPTLLAKDDDSNPIQALGVRDDGAFKGSPSGTSVRLGPFDADTKVIYIGASAAMNYKLGDSSVTAAATDHYIPAGVLVPLKTKGRLYIAFYGTGDAYVSEME